MAKDAAPVTKKHKVLIFHIGDPKTGSTSIQATLAGGHVSLASGTIFYPLKMDFNAYRSRTLEFHSTDVARAEAAERAFKSLARRIKASDADYVILSGEAIWQVPAYQFKAVVERFFRDAADEIRIIAYARPHASRFLSSYAELTKAGRALALSESLEDNHRSMAARRSLMYAERFATWKASFGDEFVVRPLITDELYNGSVVDDFLSVALDTLDFEVSIVDVFNASPMLGDLMRIKHIQRILEPEVEPIVRLRLGWEMNRILARLDPTEPGARLQLHKSLALDIQSTYVNDARIMDREYFGAASFFEDQLQAAVNDAIETPQSTEPADHLSPTELRSLEAMARLVTRLVGLGDVDWARHLRALHAPEDESKMANEPVEPDTAKPRTRRKAPRKASSRAKQPG
jgi:hypothetical protein